ncbi:MAG: lysyl-tRNA synthetase class 2 [Myxococcota bacterium]|jgi:lysyl-tRNA synthetase class 2
MYEFDDERIEKVAALREAGVKPYPHGLSVTHTTAEVQALIGERPSDELDADESEVTIAGRLMFRNLMGKAGFARIQDSTGRIQVYIKKNIIGAEPFDEIWKKLDIGDHIHVTGQLMRTRSGEATVKASTLTLAAKCITSLPDKHKGLTDIEFRNRHRYVDLFMNEEARETFQRRALIVRYIRRFFEDRSFMEVETPMLQVIPGGATARPFVTHHNALDMELFMRVAPELYLKRLVVGGFERVFEINRNFRNEGISTKHNPEFTMLEFYWSYATWHDLMDLTEQLVRELAETVCGSAAVPYGEETLDFGVPWRRLPMADAIAEATGLSAEAVRDVAALRACWIEAHPADAKNPTLPTTMGRWFEKFFDAYVEPGLIQPTFITHFPTEISPLSRRSDADPEIADRFELFIAGREIANGFNELNDPVDQAGRFAAQVAEREGGDDEAMYFDADYINALSYGMPPTAGEGIGIDRLVMLLTDRHSIRDVILFPTLRRER